MAAPHQRPTLRISGSSTLLPVAGRVAEVYLTDRPDLMLTLAGSGTGEGIRSLIDGNCDIADASRDLKPEESERAGREGVRLIRHVVALDCLAVIVHPSNPVGDLTMAQLKGVYDGSISNWSQVGGPDMAIVAINRDSSSGTFEMWIEKVLGGARHRRDVQVQSSSGGVAYAVAGNRHAVGYVSLGFLSEEVKTLAVDGALPSKETALSGRYPIVRDLYMFVREDQRPEVGKFLDFMLSERGRDLVEGEGFLAPPDATAGAAGPAPEPAPEQASAPAPGPAIDPAARPAPVSASGGALPPPAAPEAPVPADGP
jgi:phosphate transport system substrate-binding protein